jgi:hypothetical protein
MLTEAQAVVRLRKVLEAATQTDGGVKAWAKAKRLHYSYVLAIRDGERPMSDKVAATIGLKRVHGWEDK